jgi:hypothetical protein
MLPFFELIDPVRQADQSSSNLTLSQLGRHGAAGDQQDREDPR